MEEPAEINREQLVNGEETIFNPSDIFRLRTSIVEIIEDLKLRQTVEKDNEERIGQLLAEKHELERNLDKMPRGPYLYLLFFLELWEFEKRSRQCQEEKFQQESIHIKQQCEDKLRTLEEEQKQFQILKDCAEKEMKALKEEARTLQLANYKLEKHVKELEAKQATQERSSETQCRQLTELEKKVSAIKAHYHRLEGSQSRLDNNVEEALRLNRSLMLVNRHKDCIISQLRQDTSSLRSQVVEARAWREQETGVAAAERQQQQDEVHRLRVKISMFEMEKLSTKRELDVCQETGQATLNNLKTAHRLIEQQQQRISSHEAELCAAQNRLSQLQQQFEDVQMHYKSAVLELEQLQAARREEQTSWLQKVSAADSERDAAKQQQSGTELMLNEAQEKSRYLRDSLEAISQQLAEAQARLNVERNDNYLQTDISLFLMSSMAIQTEVDHVSTSTQVSPVTSSAASQSLWDMQNSCCQSEDVVTATVFSQTFVAPMFSQCAQTEQMVTSCTTWTQTHSVSSLEQTPHFPLKPNSDRHREDKCKGEILSQTPPIGLPPLCSSNISTVHHGRQIAKCSPGFTGIRAEIADSFQVTTDLSQVSGERARAGRADIPEVLVPTVAAVTAYPSLNIESSETSTDLAKTRSSPLPVAIETKHSSPFGSGTGQPSRGSSDNECLAEVCTPSRSAFRVTSVQAEGRERGVDRTRAAESFASDGRESQLSTADDIILSPSEPRLLESSQPLHKDFINTADSSTTKCQQTFDLQSPSAIARAEVTKEIPSSSSRGTGKDVGLPKPQSLGSSAMLTMTRSSPHCLSRSTNPSVSLASSFSSSLLLNSLQPVVRLTPMTSFAGDSSATKELRKESSPSDAVQRGTEFDWSSKNGKNTVDTHNSSFSLSASMQEPVEMAARQTMGTWRGDLAVQNQPGPKPCTMTSTHTTSGPTSVDARSSPTAKVLPLTSSHDVYSLGTKTRPLSRCPRRQQCKFPMLQLQKFDLASKVTITKKGILKDVRADYSKEKTVTFSLAQNEGGTTPESLTDHKTTLKMPSSSSASKSTDDSDNDQSLFSDDDEKHSADVIIHQCKRIVGNLTEQNHCEVAAVFSAPRKRKLQDGD